MREEQERLKNRQAELERMRKQQMEQLKNSSKDASSNKMDTRPAEVNHINRHRDEPTAANRNNENEKLSNDMMNRFRINQIEEQDNESENYLNRNGYNGKARDSNYDKMTNGFNNNNRQNNGYDNGFSNGLSNGRAGAAYDDDLNRGNLDDSAVIIQSAYRGFKDRKNIRAIQSQQPG
jgi:hypothetical protein